MSIQAIAYVLERERETTGVERLVLLALANHADGAFECYPAIELIAYEANAHVDSVRKALRSLDAKGLITRKTNAAPDERIPRDRRPNLYRIVQKNGRDETPLPREGQFVRNGRDDSSSTGGTKRPSKPSSNRHRTADDPPRPRPPGLDVIREQSGAPSDRRSSDELVAGIQDVRSALKETNPDD